MRVNNDITNNKVMLIGVDGNKIGILDIRSSLNMAMDAGLDLVEMHVEDGVSVCKLMDYGKILYKKSKKQKKIKNREKEIQLKTCTASWDEKTKVNNCLEFLSKGHSVRVKCSTRGRVISLQDCAQQKMKGFINSVQEKTNIIVNYLSGSPDTDSGISCDVREVVCLLQAKVK